MSFGVGPNEVVPVDVWKEGYVPFVRQSRLEAAAEDLLDARRTIEELRGQLHKLRGENDGLQRSLNTQRRLLGEATERADQLKQSRTRAYSVIDAHAGRLDAIVDAIAQGNVAEALALAKDWRDRE